ncbi:ubiquitin carboxyl-terminal hydrolase 26 [Carlito syrichta]|uniref:ubiquitinyl hydrolase 1 n=1 Tax=Carlito syrichta TaxID=1868482 RepID=A0A1U7UQ50_CARSF|nr:ubiquitin carboxyl-terminal hydrolase 26 [Carlito syrichta]
MSESKEALIEMVEGDKIVELGLFFRIGQYKAFQLNDNIKSVALRSYGENENSLHLTFQNNSLLCIERLSSHDAEQLKIFLDKVHQNKLPPLMRPDKDGDVFANTATQKEINKTSYHEDCGKSSRGSFETPKGSSTTAALYKMLLHTSELSTHICRELSENRHGKRKRMLLSSSEMNENSQKEKYFTENMKYKANALRYISHKWKKKWKLKELEENKKLEFGSSFMTKSTGNPYLDGTGLLQTLIKKILVTFLLESKYTEDDKDWEEFMLSFFVDPGKPWKGFPNLGNTCYMNAVLQSLFSIPSFAADLLNQDFPWAEIPFDAVAMCLAQLLVLKDIYNIRIKKKLLVNIKKSISAVAEIFSDDKQNDAHEFLGECLDQLKDNMKKLNTIWKTKSESGEENSPQQVFVCDAATKRFFCPVITNFESELLCSITCKACGQVVFKTEPNNFLSINLPRGMEELPLSIQSTFDHFFKTEHLEYKCEMCKHKYSFTVSKFSRLPRVLIVHLKRYMFNEFWSLRKDDQEVIISKYLNVSSHCNESTKPPLPLSINAQTRDFQLLKHIQEIISETISSSIPSTKDSLGLHIGLNRESEKQKCQKVFKGASREQQQKYLEINSKLNKIEPGDGALTEKELSAPSVTYLEDTSLSLIHKDGGKPTSSSDTCLSEVHLQEMPESPRIEKYVKSNIFVDFDTVTEHTEDFPKDKNCRIPEVFQKGAEQTQQCDGMRIYEQAPHQAPSQSFPKPDAQGHTENFRRSTKLNVQEANRNPLCSLGSSKNPGNKDILDKMKSKTKKPKGNVEKEHLHTYQIIGVVSHLGNTPYSGHYISDAYNFEKQTWFTYNDMQVSNIQEEAMLEARLCTGYIFFYMHNEIFEELLKKEDNSQL